MTLIKERRLKIGLTQDELAKKLSVNQNSVSQWEQGKAKPRADKLIKLATLLGCTVDDLLKT